MPQSRSLTLIAPQLAPALALAIAEQGARWPELARLAGRGALSQLSRARTDEARSLNSWQVALLDALGLRDGVAHYPSAAVTRTGDINQPAAGFWMHALPLHFAAGLDHLTAVLLDDANRISEAERTELEPLIASHLREAGFELMRTTRGEWLVHADRALDIRTSSAQVAASSPLDEVLPQGRDAAALRRLMTELQMLLHEHPVNQRRARHGLLEINAVWLYGEGSIAGAHSGSLPQAFGDDAYLRGIYLLNERTIAAAPRGAEALLTGLNADAVAVIDVADLDTFESAWLAPLARALARGRIARLNVVFDQWQLAVQRSALFKIWRPARSPSQWLAS